MIPKIHNKLISTKHLIEDQNQEVEDLILTVIHLEEINL